MLVPLLQKMRSLLSLSWGPSPFPDRSQPLFMYLLILYYSHRFPAQNCALKAQNAANHRASISSQGFNSFWRKDNLYSHFMTTTFSYIVPWLVFTSSPNLCFYHFLAPAPFSLELIQVFMSQKWILVLEKKNECEPFFFFGDTHSLERIIST